MSDIIDIVEMFTKEHRYVKFFYLNKVCSKGNESIKSDNKYAIYAELLYCFGKSLFDETVVIRVDVSDDNEHFKTVGDISASPLERREMIKELLRDCPNRDPMDQIDACFKQVFQDHYVCIYSQFGRRGPSLHSFPMRGRSNEDLHNLITLRRFIATTFEKHDADYLTVFFKGHEYCSRFIIFQRHCLDTVVNQLTIRIGLMERDKQIATTKSDESKRLNLISVIMFMISQMSVGNKIKILHVTKDGDTVSRSFTKNHYYEIFPFLMNRLSSLLGGKMRNDFFSLIFYHEDKSQAVQTVSLHKDKCSEDDIGRLNQTLQELGNYNHELDYIINCAARTLFRDFGTD